jgi:hypothetical protein
MKRTYFFLGFLVLWTGICPAQRVPGRVGGSIDNPQVDRPAGPANAPAARTAPTARTMAALSPDQNTQFQEARKHMPELSESGFRELLDFSLKLHDLGKNASAVDLASELHKRGGDVIGMLKAEGLSNKQAKTLTAQR